MWQVQGFAGMVGLKRVGKDPFRVVDLAKS